MSERTPNLAAQTGKTWLKMEPERIAAAKNGQTTYIGRPCPKGHGSERYVISNMCKGCQAEKSRRRYHRIKAQLAAIRQEG